MSARITVIFFILICLEIGSLLVILPWLTYPSWTENYLLVAAVDKLHFDWLGTVMKSGYLRGAVTGLGLINIGLGLWEIANFNKTVRTFQTEWQGKEIDNPSEPAGLRNNGSAAASTEDRPGTEPPH